MLSPINRVINRRQRGGLTNILALVGTILVLALNSILILQTFGVPIPGLSDAG
jgi:manganese transport protein